MKIKRYLDKDMRHVLRQVREDQGPDAVILSNRRVEDGIEVIAAIDYDESLVKHALAGDKDANLGSEALARLVQNSVDEQLAARQADAGRTDPETVSTDSSNAQILRASLKATPRDTQAAADLSLDIIVDDEPTATEASPDFADALKGVTEEAVNPAAQEPAEQDTTLAGRSVPEVALQSMQDELSSLRSLLETQLSGLVWKDSTRRFPKRVQVLRNLAKLGVAPDIANLVLNRMPPIDDDDLWKAPLITLAQAIPVARDTLLEEGGVAALIGPTGVGKTTTIAKLASRFAIEHGPDDIALISADSYRIGAREHLKAFANIIGVGVHSASEPDELHGLIERLSARHKLVLIDTEGRSQRDRDLSSRLAAYGSHAERVRFYLTLSSATQEAGLDEAVRTFNQVPLSGCVVTKIDEAAQLGCMISAAIRHDLPIAWLADGQRIPDDLHPAARKRLWLVNQALECAQASQPRIDERVMAENYSEASVANG
ncbi:MAG: flagellar biosynthesis protein FlhF [Pseudomonadota bacterium]